MAGARICEYSSLRRNSAKSASWSLTPRAAADAAAAQRNHTPPGARTDPPAPVTARPASSHRPQEREKLHHKHDLGVNELALEERQKTTLHHQRDHGANQLGSEHRQKTTPERHDFKSNELPDEENEERLPHLNDSDLHARIVYGMSRANADEAERALTDTNREEGEINEERHEDISMDIPEPWGPGKASASFGEQDPWEADAMDEDETYGPHKWRPGTEMTWAQYQANARMFGDVAFQRTLPKHHRGPLPDRAEVHKNLQLQDYIAMAWVEHEKKKPAAPNESRASPPRESQFSTNEYTGQSRAGTYPDSYYLEDADWFPWVSYWPNNVEPEYAIRANRVNAPPVPPPPEVPKKLRWDGRYGRHERTWLAQWGNHEEGLRHLAFIPIKAPRIPREFDLLKKEGGWYFAVHAEEDDDIAWFR
ncbi:hypothetical protein AURDEDRAFT_178228, partial [Auricularia subglabra TFB-10046 SS5]